MNALIGASGPLGQFLEKTLPFDYIIDPSNIHLIRNKRFVEIICVLADSEIVSEGEEQKDTPYVERLQDILSEVKCDRFILLSSEDVFEKESPITEKTPYKKEDAVENPFTRNRIKLEKFIHLRFGRVLTLHAPHIFTPDYQTGILADILAGKPLSAYPATQFFSYYPLDRLSSDISKAWRLGLSCLNLAPTPLSAEQIALALAPELCESLSVRLPSSLEQSHFESLHAIHWLDTRGYLFSEEDSLAALVGLKKD